MCAEFFNLKRTFPQEESSTGGPWLMTGKYYGFKQENIVFLIRQRKHILKFDIKYILLILMFLHIWTLTAHVPFANKQRSH